MTPRPRRCLLALALGLLAAPLSAADPKDPVLKLQGHTSDVTTVAFHPNGKFLASASNTDVRVWDLATGKEVWNAPFKGGNVYGLAYSPDGKKLAVGSALQVRVLDAATGKDESGFATGQYVFRMAFSPDGKSLAVSGGHSGDKAADVHLWDPKTGQKTLSLTGHTESVLCVAYSPDGKWLVSGSGGTTGVKPGDVRLWEASTGRLHRTLGSHAANVYAVAFSADGRRVASASGSRAAPGKGELKVWEAATGQEVFAGGADLGTLYGVAFTPNGRRLVTTGGDKTLRVLDLLTGQEVLKLSAHDNIVYSLACHPDGDRLATCGMDRAVKVWEMKGVMPARPVPAALKPADLEARWGELGGTDGARAYRAVWALAGAPEQAVPYLGKQLRPVPKLKMDEEETVARWLKDLESPRFLVRDRAAAELTKLGEATLPFVRDALKRTSSLDTRRHLERLADELSTPALSQESLQAIRAIEVLEEINNPQSRELLTKLGEGLTDARLTVEARTALGRMKAKP